MIGDCLYLYGVDFFIKCLICIILLECIKSDKFLLILIYFNNLILENKIGCLFICLFIIGCVFRIFDIVDVLDLRDICVFINSIEFFKCLLVISFGGMIIGLM